MSNAVSLKSTFSDLFMDPISLDALADPVISSCGHTFSRQQITGWMNTPAQRAAPTCPLCKKPIAQLATNILVRQALEVLNNPVNSLAGRVEDLTDEEKDSLLLAAEIIKRQREEDAKNSVPSKLEKPQFFEKLKIASQQFYSKGKSSEGDEEKRPLV